MKKTLALVLIVLILSLLIGTSVVAVEEINTMEQENANDILEIKDSMKTKTEEYAAKYGSEAYGTAACILDMARIYSIPICFIGIVLGALYQYVLGTRRLDMKHKGYGIIMTFVTLLVVCQILPLIFAIVVKGWRG